MEYFFIILGVSLCITLVLVGTAKRVDNVVSYKPIEVATIYKFFDEYNDYRIGLGYDKVVCDKLLTEMAMGQVDYLFKNTPTNLHIGYGDRQLKANAIEFGEVAEYNFHNALQAYLNSPKHKKILDNRNFNYIGIGEKGGYQCVILAKYD